MATPGDTVPLIPRPPPRKLATPRVSNVAKAGICVAILAVLVMIIVISLAETGFGGSRSDNVSPQPSYIPFVGNLTTSIIYNNETCNQLDLNASLVGSNFSLSFDTEWGNYTVGFTSSVIVSYGSLGDYGVNVTLLNTTVPLVESTPVYLFWNVSSANSTVTMVFFPCVGIIYFRVGEVQFPDTAFYYQPTLWPATFLGPNTPSRRLLNNGGGGGGGVKTVTILNIISLASFFTNIRLFYNLNENPSDFSVINHTKFPVCGDDWDGAGGCQSSCPGDCIQVNESQPLLAPITYYMCNASFSCNASRGRSQMDRDDDTRLRRRRDRYNHDHECDREECDDRCPTGNCSCTKNGNGNSRSWRCFCNYDPNVFCTVDPRPKGKAFRWICSCKAGFTDTARSSGVYSKKKDKFPVCVDINECTTTNPQFRANCSTNARCNNTIGSYSCTCNSGYIGNGQVCAPVVTCDGNATQIVLANGQTACQCKTGWSGAGTPGTCRLDGNCTNLSNFIFPFCPGISFCNNVTQKCECPVGYAGVWSLAGRFCQTCEIGYVAPTTGLTVCMACAAGKFGVIANTSSNFTTCVDCPIGRYTNVSAAAFCPGCPSGRAAPSNGTVNCSICPAGTYSVQPGCGHAPSVSIWNGTTPDDNTSVFGVCLACPNGTISAAESPSCSACPTGYTSAPNRTVCVDINECLMAGMCMNGTTCVNTDGGHLCIVNNVSNPCTDGTVRCDNVTSQCIRFRNGQYGCVCETNWDVNTTTPVFTCKPHDGCALDGGNDLCMVGSGGNCSIVVQPIDFNDPSANTYTHTCTRCPSGYRGEAPANVSCVDIDECSENSGICGPTASACNNTPGSYQCLCTPYQIWNGSACVGDPNVCTNANIDCGNHSTCTFDSSQPPIYAQCQCNPGYMFDFSSGACIPELIPYCDNPSACDNVTSSCLIVENGHNYTCVCGTGFYDPTNAVFTRTCQDYNECTNNASSCDPISQVCVNTYGSHSCACAPGYVLWAANSSCVLGSALCRDGTSYTDGSCVCNVGYQGPPVLGPDGYTCVDIDECASYCLTNSVCSNSPGSFDCLCSNGYGYNSATRSCVDIDECVIYGSSSVCNPLSSVCSNTQGGYVCNCLNGARPNVSTDSFDFHHCIDVDECALCSFNPTTTTCTNTNFSYTLGCISGYAFTTPTTGSLPVGCPSYVNISVCADVNECLSNETNNCDPVTTTCLNNAGSFSCACTDPSQQLILNNTVIYCEAPVVLVDECTNASHVCDAQSTTCVDDTLGYHCSCKTHYTNYNPSTNKCDPVNTCAGDPCGPRASCVFNASATSGYSCTCLSTAVLNGSACDDRDECLTTVCDDYRMTCNNLDPGFSCDCPEGFYVALDKGKETCVAINYCYTSDNGNHDPIYDSASTHCTTLPNGTNVYDCITPTYGPNVQVQVVDAQTGLVRYYCTLYDPCNNGPIGCDLSSTHCAIMPLGSSGPDIFDNGVGLYRCNCNSGFVQVSGNYTSCEGFTSLCNSAPAKCGSFATCVDSPDFQSYSCTCNAGYVFVSGSNTTCEAINCNNSPPNPPCDPTHGASCVASGGVTQCVCGSGFEPFPYINTTANKTQCLDLNECAKPTACIGTGAVCTNSLGSYACSCSLPGYTLIGNECILTDICASNTSLCDTSISRCKLVGTSQGYICECKSGYEQVPDGSNTLCQDVDECVNLTPESQACTQNGFQTQCVNTLGSWYCDCANPGHQGINATFCTVDPGVSCSCSGGGPAFPFPAAPDTYLCPSPDTCVCDGDIQVRPGLVCLNNQNPCNDPSTCPDSNVTATICEYVLIPYSNCGTFGNESCSFLYCNETVSVSTCSFDGNAPVCGCVDGFDFYPDGLMQWDGSIQYCVDRDECALVLFNGTDVCDSANTNLLCQNTFGSYQCICDATTHFVNPDLECVALGACAGDPCDIISTQGCFALNESSFECPCRQGFVTNPASTLSCLDLNECDANLVSQYCNTSSTYCTNSFGSYTCSCNPGFFYRTFGPSVWQCIDFDECQTVLPPCGTQHVCRNLDGSFECLTNCTDNVTFTGCSSLCSEGFGYDAASDSCENVRFCTQELSCTGDRFECFPLSNTNLSLGGTCQCPPQYAFDPVFEQCSPCTAGYFPDPLANYDCEFCPIGTYTSEAGQSVCQPVPPGYITVVLFDGTSQTFYSGGITSCAPGTYSAGYGNTLCTPCDVGSVSLRAQASCTVCPPTTVQTGPADCTVCPLGSHASEDRVSCIACLAGTYATGTSVQATCLECPIGTYSADMATTCTACPTGQIAADSGSTQCMPCPLGSTPAIDSFSGACVFCPAGSEGDPNLPGTCRLCSEGSFSTNAGDNCTVCDPGQYSNAVLGSTGCTYCDTGYASTIPASHSCEICPEGTYWIGFGAGIAGACESCPFGTVAPLPGSADCVACPAGRAATRNTSLEVVTDESSMIALTGGLLCLDCAAGLYQDVNTGYCVRCPQGTLNRLTGQTTCLPCDPGFISNATGSIFCYQCPAGYSSHLSSSYVPGELQTQCYGCSAGDYSFGGLELCFSCPSQTFSSDPFADSCQVCDEGALLLTGQSACQYCPAGQQIDSSGRMCSDCPVGFAKSTISGVCTPCSFGTYTNTTGSSLCLDCDPNYEALDGVVCTACTDGYDNADGGLCEPCSVGSFSESGQACQLCPANSYNSIEGSAICTPCDPAYVTNGTDRTRCVGCEPGFYVVNVSAISANPNQSFACVPCAAGNYCPDFSLGNIFQCPAGTINPSVGSVSIQACVSCGAGNFSSDIGSAGPCTPCPVDTYTVGVFGATSCEPCPSNTYTDNTTGNYDITSCRGCPPGSVRDGALCVTCLAGYYQNTDVNLCLGCAAGFFSGNETVGSCSPCGIDTYLNTSFGTSCVACPGGTVAPSAGSTTCTDCNGNATCAKNCTLGSFLNVSANVCVLCTEGRYNNGSNGGNQTACTPCALGQSSRTGATMCTSCAPGRFGNTTGGICYACPQGLFNSQYGESACGGCSTGRYTTNGLFCVGCGSGSFLDTTNSSIGGTCRSCNPGTASNLLATTVCADCTAGRYQPSLGGTSCVQCPSGTISDTGSYFCAGCAPGSRASFNQSYCVSCDPGYFTSTTQNTVCQPCPIGKAALYSGSSQCTDCPAGTVPGSFFTSSTCTPCAPGRAWRESTSNTTFECTQCEAGTFTATNGSLRCFQCPAGTVTPSIERSGVAIPLTGQSYCLSCSAGRISNAGSSVCVLCPNGTTASDNSDSCTPCPSGTYTLSGVVAGCQNCPTGKSSLSGGTCEQCQGTTYAENGGPCGPCPEGRYRTGSTLNASVSTLACPYCPVNTYNGQLGATACIACAAGKFSTNGSSACVTCPLGNTRAIGETDCSPCGSGFFSPFTISTNATTNISTVEPSGLCFACSPGTASNETGSLDCSSCLVGFFAASYGQTECAPCAAGRFAAAQGATSCQTCPAGTVQPSIGAANCSLVCPEDTFKFNGSHCASCSDFYDTGYGAAVGSDACYSCRPGSYITSQGCAPCPANLSNSISDAKTCVYVNASVPQDTAGSTAAATAGTCVDCPKPCAPGSYKFSDTLCVLCPANTYMDRYNTDPACLPCSYFPGSLTSPIGSTSFSACVSYCEANQILDLSQESLTRCQSCQPGRFANSTQIDNNYINSWNEIMCSICPSGRFSTLSGQPCSACPAGSFSNDPYGATGCSTCAVDTFASSSGSSSCQNCPQGTFTASTGSTSISQCAVNCPAGRYSSTGTFNQLTCLNCPSGRVAATANIGSQCTLCPAGTFSSANRQVCTPCPIATFSNTSGVSACTRCLQPNQTTVSTGTSSLAGCVSCTSSPSTCPLCGAGTYRSESTCAACPAGKVQTASNTHTTSCVSCLAGFFSNASFASTGCVACPNNTFSPFGDASTCIACDLSSIGSPSVSSGATACGSCVLGHVPSSAPIRSSCEACLPGTFTNSSSALTCTACSAGRYSSYSRATECLVCAAGTRALLPLKSPGCSTCPTNFVSNASAIACVLCAGAITTGPGSSTCQNCPVGTAFSRPNPYYLGVCQACALGRYNNVSEPFATCKACPSGKKSNVGSSSCVTCGAGSQASPEEFGGSCNACLEGRFSTSASSSLCVSCPEPLFTNVSGTSICTRCPAGKTTDINQGATTCVDCPDRTYRSSDMSSCAPCAWPNLAKDNCTSQTYMCPAGTLILAPGDCRNCRGRYFSPLPDATQCSECPANTYSVNGLECVDCPPPTQRIFGGFTCEFLLSHQILFDNGTRIDACPLHYYASYNFFTDTVTCRACQLDHYRFVENTWSLNRNQGYECIPCQVGFQSFNGTCEKCPAGTEGYYDLVTPQGPGQGCISCKKGTFKRQASGENCLQCQPGFFANVTGSIACTACPAGYFSSLEATRCDVCEAGKFSVGGQGTCANCPAGTFGNSSGQTSCLTVPAGYYQPSGGQTSFLACNDNGQWSFTGQTACSVCRRGQYPAAPFPSTTCNNCAAGTFSNGSVCNPCAAGTYSAEGASTCIECDFGTYSSSNSSSCTTCPLGSYQPLSGQAFCDPCPVGSISINPRLCSPCPSGQIPKDRIECVNCLPGFFNPMIGQSTCSPCPSETFTGVSGSFVCQSCLYPNLVAENRTRCIRFDDPYWG